MSNRLDTEAEEDAYLDERTADLTALEPTPGQRDRKKRKKLVELDAAEELAKAYALLLRMREGRLVLHDRLDKLGYWEKAFTAGLPDVTAYQNGQRSAAVDLFNDLWTVDSDAVLTMFKENRT